MFYDALIQAGKDGDVQQLKELQETVENKLASGLDVILQHQVGELKGESKRSVLVLDDLDRMDPEHIFRMLNILSAKMELDDANELGFDHIILAGDIANIKHIFHHKYGEETDFQGYFDKFASTRPYVFDNTVAVIDWIETAMIGSVRRDDTLRDSLGSSGYLRIQLEEILKQLIRFKELNLRQLYRPIRHLMPELSEDISRESSVDGSRGPELL